MATYNWPSRVYDFSPDQTSSDGSIIYNPTTGWETGAFVTSVSLAISSPSVGYFTITVYDTNADSIGYLEYVSDGAFDEILKVPVAIAGYDIDYVELYNEDLVSVTSKAISASLGKVVSLDAAISVSNTTAIGFSGAVSKFPYNQLGSDLANVGTSGAADYDHFGAGVALSGDGQVLAVGAPGYSSFSQGAVYTYDKSGAAWTLRSSSVKYGGYNYANYGGAVALSSTGLYMAIGSSTYSQSLSNRGLVQVYEYSAPNWNTRGSSIVGGTSDRVGEAVALSSDGGVLGIGASGRDKSGGPSDCGAVLIYDWAGSGYGLRSTIHAPDAASNGGFGSALSMSADGNTFVVSAIQDDTSVAGKVYTFDWSGAAWSQRGATLTNSDTTSYNQFGVGLALSGDGEKLFVQAKVAGYGQSVVFVYQKSGTSWALQNRIESALQANPDYGYNARCDIGSDVSGTMLVVGSPEIDVSGGTDNGSVYTLMSDSKVVYLSGAVMTTYTTTTSLNAFIAENVEDVSDNSTASDTPVPGVTTSGTLTDSGAGVTEALEVAHIFCSLSESAAGVSATADSQLTFLLEAVAAAETQALQVNGVWTYSDTLAANDALVSIYQDFVSEAAAGSVSTTAVLAVLLNSMLQSVDTMSTQGSFINALAQLAASVDILEKGLLEGVSDSATASTTLRYSAYLIAMDQASGVDTASSFILVTEPVVDSGVVAETLSLVQALNYAWADVVNIYVRLGISGEVVTGWVMNTQTSAASEYQGFSFNSMAKIAGKYYGASDTGVYEMSGDTDAGTTIATYIKTGLLDFPDTSGKIPRDAQKRISHLYLVCDASGAVAIKAVSVERGAVTENFYSVTMSPDATENTRVLMGKGARGRYWMLEIGSEALETFDAVSIYPIYLSRRI
jgi:hypothetical protein